MSEHAAQARQMLAEVVRGSDDEALVQMVENLGGAPGFLDLTFQGMEQALIPEKAQDAVIGWQIVQGDDVHAFRMEVSGGRLTWEQGEARDARVTLRLTLPNYLRLIAGELEGMQAFMTGALQVMGDIIFAAQLHEMFAGLPAA